MDTNLNTNLSVKFSFLYLIYYYYGYRLLFDVFLIYLYIDLINVSQIGFHNNTLYFLLKILINFLFTMYSNIEYYLLNYIKSNTVSYIGYMCYMKINNLLLSLINKIYNKSITILSNKLFKKLNFNENNLNTNILDTKENIYSFLNKIKS